MTSTHPIHLPDTVYLPPDIHIPRDITDEEFDDTSFWEDARLAAGGEPKAQAWDWTDQEFEQWVMEENGIWPSFQQPHDEPVSVLLPVPTTPAQERELFEQVMTSLRKRVAELEEEELFESAMRKFTHRTTMTANSVDPSANILMVAGGGGAAAEGVPVMGDPEAAGLGEQPRTSDVAELLRADLREVRERERIKANNGKGQGGSSSRQVVADGMSL